MLLNLQEVCGSQFLSLVLIRESNISVRGQALESATKYSHCEPLNLGPSKADPDTRSWVQVACLEDGMTERGEWDRKEGRTSKGCHHEQMTAVGTWGSSPWGSFERRCRLLFTFIPLLGRKMQRYPPTLVLYCLRLVPEVPTPRHFCMQVTSQVGQAMWWGTNGMCYTKKMLIHLLEKIGSLYSTL